VIKRDFGETPTYEGVCSKSIRYFPRLENRTLSRIICFTQMSKLTWQFIKLRSMFADIFFSISVSLFFCCPHRIIYGSFQWKYFKIAIYCRFLRGNISAYKTHFYLFLFSKVELENSRYWFTRKDNSADTFWRKTYQFYQNQWNQKFI
jgi:hypothetical protein